MLRTDVGRCPACGLGVSVGILEVEGSDQQLERFTCGHRIAGPSQLEAHVPGAVRKLYSTLTVEFPQRARRTMLRTRDSARRVRAGFDRFKR